MVDVVFPAYAGMFRRGRDRGQQETSFPRVRGDVPQADGLKEWRDHVFPAYAGMFRARTRSGALSRGFSPRTRGCSYQWGEPCFCW